MTSPSGLQASPFETVTPSTIRCQLQVRVEAVEGARCGGLGIVHRAGPEAAAPVRLAVVEAVLRAIRLGIADRLEAAGRGIEEDGIRRSSRRPGRPPRAPRAIRQSSGVDQQTSSPLAGSNRWISRRLMSTQYRTAACTSQSAPSPRFDLASRTHLTSFIACPVSRCAFPRVLCRSAPPRKDRRATAVRWQDTPSSPRSRRSVARPWATIRPFSRMMQRLVMLKTSGTFCSAIRTLMPLCRLISSQGGADLRDQGRHDAVRGLVQQHDRRIGHDAAADRQHLLLAAAHACRRICDEPLPQTREVVEHLVDAGCASRGPRRCGPSRGSRAR